MNDRKSPHPVPNIAGSHSLFSCPAFRPVHLLPKDQSFIKEALSIGLLVGITGFTSLYKGIGSVSFSIISGVVSGIFVTYLSYKYLNEKNTVRVPLEDEGFFGPDSLAWKIGSEPSLSIAATGAGILQMLLAPVMKLVRKNNKFFEDPQGRGRRTGLHLGVGD